MMNMSGIENHLLIFSRTQAISLGPGFASNYLELLKMFDAEFVSPGVALLGGHVSL